MLSDQNKTHSTELGTFRLEKYRDELGPVRLEDKNSAQLGAVKPEQKAQHWPRYCQTTKAQRWAELGPVRLEDKYSAELGAVRPEQKSRAPN